MFFPVEPAILLMLALPWALLSEDPAGSILLAEPPIGTQSPVPEDIMLGVLIEPVLERPMTPEPVPVTMDTVLDPVPTLVIVPVAEPVTAVLSIAPVPDLARVPDPEVVTAGVLVAPEPVTSAPAGVRVPVPEVVGA